MSGFNIDHGGAISVDPAVLRGVADRISALARRFGYARTSIVRAHGLVAEASFAGGYVDTGALWASGERAGALEADCESLAAGTVLMADVFEYVELRVQAEALALSDEAAAAALRARMAELEEDARIAQMADMLVRGWEERRFEGLDSQFDLGGALAPFFLGGAFAGANFGLGKVLPGMTLSGKADPVSVTAVGTGRPSAPPAGFADAFRRLGSGAGQIRVEKYTFADGSTKYLAYLKGTQALFGSDPWDMKSNLDLYSGTRSASYQATLDALAAAGAKPGDEVDVVAHSQSGMIAAHLAMESEFDVQVQITAGSPVEPTLGEDQTLVQFRHTDDIVSSLSGGGTPAGTGSQDSFVVTREGDPVDGPQDALADTHWMHSYIETAEQVDASGDPRVDGMRDFWDHLDEAVKIESTDYRAERK